MIQNILPKKETGEQEEQRQKGRVVSGKKREDQHLQGQKSNLCIHRKPQLTPKT